MNDTPNVQRNAAGAVTAWDNIVTMYQKMVQCTPMLPNQDPDSIAHARLKGFLMRTPTGGQRVLYPDDWPPVLSTTTPFPISYAAAVWDQLHPLGELLRRHSTNRYLPNPLSNIRRHP